MGLYAMTGGATGIGAAIKQALRDEGNTIIVIEHNLDVVKVADYVIDKAQMQDTLIHRNPEQLYELRV